MRKMHKAVHLIKHIQRFKQRQASGRIVDPELVHTTNIIGLIITFQYPIDAGLHAIAYRLSDTAPKDEEYNKYI